MLTLITGPMYSGKTSELIRYADRAKIANKNIFIIKYAGDVRYTDTPAITTHNNLQCNAHIVERDDLLKLDLTNYDYIFIDEAQFFNKLDIFLKKWADRSIYLAALNADFQGLSWNNIAQLGPVERYINLSAICEKCNADAHFTERVSDSNYRELIGGKKDYIAVCRACFNKKDNTSDLVKLNFIV